MDQPIFTISACHRCRKRKTRCDSQLPACIPCQKIGSRCEYNDVQTKELCSRDYICSLEAEVGRLEHELRQLQFASRPGFTGGSHEQVHSPSDVISPDHSTDDNQAYQAHPARYLGVSSGMHLAQSVLNSARLNDPSIDHIPDDRTKGWSDPATLQHLESTENVNTKSILPSEEVAFSLIDVFFDQYQLQYPIVSKKWLISETSGYYRGRSNTNPAEAKAKCTAFMLQMIFAISLLAISKGNQNEKALLQAERFHASAMADLTVVMESKSLETLQCLLLLLLYSLLHFSATPIWHISGLCMRMCIDLGLHSETTIKVSSKGDASDDEIDWKRRLFWVTYTFDRTLSIMLGRPFTLEEKYIEVAYPDRSLPEGKRKAIVHWIKLQRLQSLGVSRSHAASDKPPESLVTWEANMGQALAAWNDEASSFADSSRYTIDWWRYWYHNSLLLLHRPTPSTPELDADRLSTCYAAAKNVIEASFIRLHTGLLDFICVDLHYQFMAGITLLFLVWNHTDIRQRATGEWTSFKSCLVQWELVLEAMAVRWDRASRAKEVVNKLSNTTIDIVEREMTHSRRDEMMGHREPSRMITRDRDRETFIMQQLGSSSTHHVESTNTYENPASAARDTLSHVAEDQEFVADSIRPGRQNGHQPQSMYPYLEEALLTNDTNVHPQGEPWQEAGFSQLAQTLRDAFNPPFLPLPSDVSAMFADNLWSSGFGPSEVSYVPNSADGLGLFQTLDSRLGDPWFDNDGRVSNMAWADSVLNFPEDWEHT